MWKTNNLTYAKKNEVNLDKIKKDLTITIVSGLKKYGHNVPDKYIYLYSFIKDLIVVPRFYINNAKYFFKLENTKNFIQEDIKLISNNQIVVFDHLKNIYAQPNGCNLIMNTGEGKTYIAIKLIQYIGRNALVVTHNRKIADEWNSIITKYCGFCGVMSGKVKQQKNITVGIIHTLIKQDKDWFKNFEFIIYDEITEFLSERRRVIFDLCQKAYLLGLSATPDVKLSKIFELYVGPRIYANKLIGYKLDEIKWKINIHAIKYYGAPEYTESIRSSLGMICAVEMCKQFMRDPVRNSFIISKIKWLRSLDIKVFVFVSICEYGDILYKLALEYFNSEEMAIFMGSSGDIDVSDKNIIFTTYNFCSKGISIPSMTGIILCHPRMADTQQTIGRILRIGGETAKERYIIDIIDMNTTLKRQFSERKNIYNQYSKIDYYNVYY